MTETKTDDEHIKKLNSLIARARGVASLVYHAPNINVDNASPREVMSEIIDELVRMKRIYEAKPGIFEGETDPIPIPFTKPKGTIQ